MPVDIEHGYAEVEELLGAVPIPRGVRVTHRFHTPPALRDIPAAVRSALRAVTMPRGRVAVGVGSRGVARIDAIVAALIAELKAAGAEPFIFPAMGSHGAATADGQADVLAHVGVSEATCGAPVRATMKTVEIGRTPAGVPVYMDANAHGADAIVVVNRVKPHTAFRGPIESGPTKMLAIGLGKQQGAHSIHAAGWGKIHATIPQAAAVAIATGKVAFALATIENAEEEPFHLEAIPAANLIEREPALQVQAKESLARLPFDELDVLVVDRIGKNISGDGADPNVTGRYPTPYGTGGPRITRMVYLDVTDESLGNANGLGMADVVTRRLAQRFLPAATYMNALTSTTPEPVRLPMTLATPRLALAAALTMCAGISANQARVVRIADTLHLRELWVSEPLLAQVAAHPDLTIAGELEPFPLPA